MAQGAVKKGVKQTSAKGGKGAARQQAKKSGVSKSKKAKTTADKFAKKYTSGLITQTEAMLGERAGHLELIGKGNRGKNKAATFKGGSRRFG